MTAQLAAPAAVAGTVMMSESEARECVERIKAGLEDVAAQLAQLHECRGWEALGYRTWGECIKHEFQMSRVHAHRLITAHKIEQVLALPIGNIERLPETHARELTPLLDEPERMRAAVVDAAEQGHGKPTAEHIHDAVDRQLGYARPKGSTSKARPVSPTRKSITSGATVDDYRDDAPTYEDQSQERYGASPNAEHWCQDCGGKYRSERCPCATAAPPDETEKQEEPSESDAPAERPGDLVIDDAAGSECASAAESVPPAVPLTDRDGAGEADPAVPASASSHPATVAPDWPEAAAPEGDPSLPTVAAEDAGASEQPAAPAPPDNDDGSSFATSNEDEKEEPHQDRTVADSKPKANGHASFSDGVGKSAGGKGGARTVTAGSISSDRKLDAGDLTRVLIDLPGWREEFVENLPADQKRALSAALGGTAPSVAEPKPAGIREALGDDGCTVLELSKAIGETFTVDARASLLALLADDMPAERLGPLAHRLNVRVRNTDGAGPEASEPRTPKAIVADIKALSIGLQRSVVSQVIEILEAFPADQRQMFAPRLTNILTTIEKGPDAVGLSRLVGSR